ncbi:MAG TPA: MMPL family transporter, partial [Myxococcota bacterium]|nr:MMPL family transporter [Myxococcota bacterium]
MTIRARIDASFESLAAIVVRHPVATIAAGLIAVGILATGLPALHVETSFDSYLPVDNPERRLYDEFRAEFGSGERVLILLRPKELYDAHFLEELTRLHQALEEELPYLDRVTSLVNARHLLGGESTLSSVGLLDDPVRSSSDLARLRDRIQSNSLYDNVVVSRDGTATALIIELDGSLGESDEPEEMASDLGGFEPTSAEGPIRGAMLTTEQAEKLVLATDRILEEHAPQSAAVYVAGTPVLAHRLGATLTRDVIVFVSVSAGLTALLLAMLFRNFWATVHPLLVVGLSVVGTLGWMGLRGIPLTAVTEILPSLLVAVGVGDSVHIQSMFFRERRFGADVSSAIRAATRHSGLALLLTSVTTGVGMAAFQSAELQPVIDLGRAAPIGVFLAWALSATFLPAMISLTHGRLDSTEETGRDNVQDLDRVLLRLGGVGTRQPASVILGTALVVSLALVGVVRLRFSQDDLRWLPEDDDVRIATEEVNRALDGAEPMEIYVVASEGVDLREPTVISALRDIETRVSRAEVGAVRVAQSISIVDVLEETHRALSDESPDGQDPTPNTRAGISQELLLFESAAPDDLARLVDAHWSRT